MRKVLWGFILSAVLAASTIFGGVALAANEAMYNSLSQTEWVYRAITRTDGSSEIWRRAAMQASEVWTRVGLVPEALEELAAYKTEPHIVLARSRYNLYRSEDAGQNWEALPGLPGLPTALALGQQSDGLIYLGTSSNGAYRSDDGGRTWVRLSASPGMLPGTTLEITALAVNPKDDAVVYAATGYWSGSTTRHFASGGIFASVDGGNTWLPVYEASVGEPRITQLTPDTAAVLAVQAVIGTETQRYEFSNISLLDEWLMSEEATARAAAVRAWGLLGGEEASQRLMGRLILEMDPAVGQVVAHTLGVIAHEEMVPALAATLNDMDPQVRWRAATVLGYLPTKNAVAALGRTLRYDDSIARSAASQALMRIGTADAVKEVMPLLDAKGLTGARHAALATLEGMGDGAVDPLLLAMASDSATRREHAAEALGFIRSPRAVDALAVALRDPSAAVRDQATWALNEIGTVEAKAALTSGTQPTTLSTLTERLANGQNGSLWVAVLVVMIVGMAAILFTGGRSRLSPRH